MKIIHKASATLSILFCIQMVSAQNLLNMDDWIAGTNGPTTNYHGYGPDTMNHRVDVLGPFGQSVVAWQARPDATDGLNGGMIHNGVVLSTNKTYRVTYWVRSEGSSNCKDGIGFFGYKGSDGQRLTQYERLDGVIHDWPKFSNVALSNDKWLLAVAYLHANDYTGPELGGIYDPSLVIGNNLPSPSYVITSYKLPSSETTLNTRAMTSLYSCGEGDNLYTYAPRLEEVNGNEMALIEILTGTSGGGDAQPPTAPTLSSIGQTDTTTDLSWTGATDDTAVTAYRIYKDGVLEAPLGNVSTYQVTGLTAGTSYNFTATALDAAGNESSVSNAVSVTTNSSGGGGSTVWNEANSVASYTGNVAVGTATVPNGYQMAIDGKLITEEVKVQLSGNWPDYVFSAEYRLPTLEEVQKHITEKGHLVNIPSASEVEAEGIELGEMNKLLLEKIEELTLYILKMDKEIKALKNKKQPQTKGMKCLH
ncbi:fibronectin type III domain-containing protein [Ulvibacterium sp.]|uniref:fibronectin type III domain-containing protein n=1 Tax=Ulvibacterium sp. TaxID=2665914 RepID=UPI003CC5BE7A